MIIIDVEHNIFRRISKSIEGSRSFYINYPERVEMFALMGNILYRYIYTKRGEEEDRLFYTNNLENSIQVNRITNVNEDRWRDMFMEIYDEIRSIRDDIRFITENVKNE